jgi:hypothetical protein
VSGVVVSWALLWREIGIVAHGYGLVRWSGGHILSSLLRCCMALLGRQLNALLLTSHMADDPVA